MFFNKRKDKERAKSKPESLTSEEMARLEETKHKIFGGLGKGKARPAQGLTSRDISAPLQLAAQTADCKPPPPPRPARPPNRGPPPPLPPKNVTSPSSDSGGTIVDAPPAYAPPPPPPVPAANAANPVNGTAGSPARHEQNTQRAVHVNGHGAQPMSPMSPLYSEWDVAESDPDSGKAPFSLCGLVLPALTGVQTTHKRHVTLKRNGDGDFGFQISRKSVRDNASDQPGGALVRNAVFVEPLCPPTGAVTMHQARGGRPSQREGPSLQSPPQRANDRAADSTASDSVWLVHSRGYAAARLLARDVHKGSVSLQLTEGGGDTLEVDAADVHKANGTKYDRCDDVSSLPYLNDTAVLHVLRQRYHCNLVHTFAGCSSTLVANSVLPLNVYGRHFVSLFKGRPRGHSKPHIYAVAQSVYRALESSGRNQSVVFTGRSGAGKSRQLAHLVSYLLQVAGSGVGDDTLTVDKFGAVLCGLSAFGNAATRLNGDASRHAVMLTLDFDHLVQVTAASVQCLLLDTDRVVRCPGAERNFLIFYMLKLGADANLQRELNLQDLDPDNVCLSQLSSMGPTERGACESAWAALHKSLDKLGVTADERAALWRVLGAVMHLTNAGATAAPASRSQFCNPASARVAAHLLGITEDELRDKIFHSQSIAEHHRQQNRNAAAMQTYSSGGSRRASKPISDRLKVTERVGTGTDALHAFVVGLYRELFCALVHLLNRAMSSTHRAVRSIGVLCVPGVQCGSVLGLDESNRPRWSTGTFTDLVYNYANERVHMLFHQASFTQPLQLYQQEKVEVDLEEPDRSPQPLVELIDKPSQQELIHSTNIEARSTEKRGILWMLDEESVFPGASDQSFLERIFAHNAQPQQGSGGLVSRGAYGQFKLRHCNGTVPVAYDVTDWVKRAAEPPLTRVALPTLQHSTCAAVSSLFSLLRPGGVAGAAGDWSSAGGGDNALRRATAALSGLGTGAWAGRLKRRSYPALAMLQTDCLIETIRRVDRIHFVHCVSPNAKCALAPGPSACALGQGEAGQSGAPMDTSLNVVMLRNQIVAIQLTDSVRFARLGYPERLGFAEFRRRFECLLPKEDESSERHNGNDDGAATCRRAGGGTPATLLDSRQAAGDLLAYLQLNPNDYRVGLSQVLLRSELLTRLEDMRDTRLTGTVTRLQALCRRYLAQRKLQTLQVQQRAVRCIQRNISKYAAVRNWPWWRLYVRVLPLVQAHATDNQRRMDQGESGELLGKLSTYERQCTELRLQCDKLQSKLAGAQADLADERATCAAHADALEQESARRLQLEHENREALARSQNLERKAGKLDMQLMEIRQLKSHYANGVDAENDDDMVRQLRQQLEALVKDHQRQVDELNEAHSLQRRQLEQRADSATQDSAELRKSADASKAKATQAIQELQDLKNHMDKLTVANAHLEKKQKRFDGELQAAVAEAESVRSQRDRFAAQNDSLDTQLRQMRRQLQESSEQLEAVQCELEAARRAPSQGVDDALQLDEQVAALRAHKAELEAKLADQEEELDDLAGRCHQQEATVTKLHMQLESDRKQHSRDRDERDAQIEQLRAHWQTRVRQLEQQLEDELEEKRRLARRATETERRVTELSTSAAHLLDEGATEATLRRDLRRTRALLRDAQRVIEQLRDQAPSKGLLKQLRNQLEDADAARLAAVKAKQRAESDIVELRGQLEAAANVKQALEDKHMAMLRERGNIQGSLEEVRYEYEELCKKYKAQVQQASVDTITISQLQHDLEHMERDVEKLKQELATTCQQVSWHESNTVDKHKLAMAEARMRDLEAKLECEATQRTAALMQLDECRRLADKNADEVADALAARDREMESRRRARDELGRLAESSEAAERRCAEAKLKCAELEQALERTEHEHQLTLADLKLAMRRIDNLQAALQDELECDSSSDEDDRATGQNDDTRSGAMSSPYPPSTKSLVGDHDEIRTPATGSTAGN